MEDDLEGKSEEAVPKTIRDYLAPLNYLVFPVVAVLVWFFCIPWFKSIGLMVSYTAVWYLSLTALSVFFAIWVFHQLDEWLNGPRNQKVQAKRIELELLRQHKTDRT